MDWDAWLTLGTVGLVVGLLVLTHVSADIVMAAGLTVLLVAGVLSPQEALSGMSNQGMVTVGVLFIVVAGLRETGGIAWITQSLLGRPRSLFAAQCRLMFPVTVLSAFLNNTPVVAMLIPAVTDWARRNRFSASKLMIPLSYAAIFGGTCTLIGTSTNLVVNGLLLAETGHSGLGMFDIAWVGVPCALVGIVYLLGIGRWLLPERLPAMSQLANPREYTVEMLVEENSPLVGKTIEKAGLRHLPGMFVVEIGRGERVVPAVGPEERLEAGDRLVFAGIVDSVVDLQRIRGLKPATNQVFKLDSPRRERTLIEAVVSNHCPLVGRTIREGRFRSVYNAVVIAAARHGRRIHMKIGDIVLRPGDVLLLEAHPSFAEQQRNARDFLLVSELADSSPLRHERAFVALGILAAMVLVASLGWLSMLKAAMLAAGAMILTRCCSSAVARRSVDWQVLIVIAASLGLGHAMLATGAAEVVAGSLISLAQGNPWATLAIVYLVTTVFTELITNNAAAVLVFPIALSTSQTLEVSFTPFAITIMMAASASFSSPIGYQTNLMVYGPGGYRFTDYTRVGLPLNVLLGVVTVLIAPRVWPFS